MFAITLQQRAIAEIDRRRGRRETYTEKLPRDAPDLKPFLMDFYRNIMFQRQAEMQQELLQYPSTVQKFYKELVVNATLATEDFWQRYYYRTGSVERVMAELQVRDDEVRRSRQAALDRLRTSVSANVQNLLAAPPATAANSSGSSPTTTTTASSPARTTVPVPVGVQEDNDDNDDDREEEVQFHHDSTTSQDGDASDDASSSSSSSRTFTEAAATTTIYDTAEQSEFAAVSDAAALRKQALQVIAGVEDALSPAEPSAPPPSSSHSSNTVYDQAEQSEFATVSTAAALRKQALQVIAGVEGALSKEPQPPVPAPTTQQQKPPPPPRQKTPPPVAPLQRVAPRTVPEPTTTTKPTTAVIPMREWKRPVAPSSTTSTDATMTTPRAAPPTATVATVPPQAPSTTTNNNDRSKRSSSGGGGLFSGMFQAESGGASGRQPAPGRTESSVSQELPSAPLQTTLADSSNNSAGGTRSGSGGGLFGMFHQPGADKAPDSTPAPSRKTLPQQDKEPTATTAPIKLAAGSATIEQPKIKGSKADSNSSSTSSLRSGGLFGMFKSEWSENATGTPIPMAGLADSANIPIGESDTDCFIQKETAKTNADAPTAMGRKKWSSLFGKGPVKNEETKTIENKASALSQQKIASTTTTKPSPPHAEPKQTARRRWFGRKKTDAGRQAPNTNSTDGTPKRIDPALESHESNTKAPRESMATLKLGYKEMLGALLVVLMAMAVSLELLEPGVLGDGLCAPVAPWWKFSPSNRIIDQAEAPWWMLPGPLKEGAFSLVCGERRQRTIVKWIEVKPTEFQLDLVEAPTGQTSASAKSGKSRVLMSTKRLHSAQILTGSIVLEGSDEKVKTIQAPWKRE